ncbi:MAG: hypothetical protein ACTSXJ_06465 [Candidatus Baldrarchaeia archaeon]
MSISPELYEFIVKVIEDKVKDIKVTREEFDKLSKNVRILSEKIEVLVEAQRQTEERLNELAKRVNDLAEAQRRTEEQVNQLAEAQRRTEERLNELARRVDELAEAQRRTEERVNQLAEAQRRTEEQLNRLAEAQRRTEEQVQELAKAVQELARQVGRLSDLIGFGLEDIARVMVPGWLERHMKIYVEDLQPAFVVVDGEEVQLNLFGIGRREGKEVIIVGECKSRIYSREVKKFAETLNKVKRAYREKDVLGFLFGFLVHPSAQKDAEKIGIKLIATYMR